MKSKFRNRKNFEAELTSYRNIYRNSARLTETFTPVQPNELGQVDYSGVFRKSTIYHMGKYAHIFGTKEDDANAVDYILN
jgi:hypothetical protein